MASLTMSNDSSGLPVPLRLEIEKLYQDSIFSNLLWAPYDPAKRSQLEDLQETGEKLKKELDEAKTALSLYCEKNDRLTEEYEKLKKETDELKNHDQIISMKKAELNNELTMLLNTKCNSHDEELVKRTKLEYKYVRNITQVRFSYEESDEDILSGYVFNKVTKNISSFSLNIYKLNRCVECFDDRLMQLMKKTSHPSYADVLRE